MIPSQLKALPSSVISTNRCLLLLPVPPIPVLIQIPLTWTIVTNQKAYGHHPYSDSVTLHLLPSNLCVTELCSHRFTPTATQNSSTAPTAYKIKTRILKTAFQGPYNGAYSCLPLSLCPRCPPHTSAPAQMKHCICSYTHLHIPARAFTHSVLPRTPSPSSLCIHFVSTLQDPNEMLFLP